MSQTPAEQPFQRPAPMLLPRSKRQESVLASPGRKLRAGIYGWGAARQGTLGEPRNRDREPAAQAHAGVRRDTVVAVLWPSSTKEWKSCLMKVVIMFSASQVIGNSPDHSVASSWEASLNISRDTLCSGKIILSSVIQWSFENSMIFLFGIFLMRRTVSWKLELMNFTLKLGIVRKKWVL